MAMQAPSRGPKKKGPISSEASAGDGDFQVRSWSESRDGPEQMAKKGEKTPLRIPDDEDPWSDGDDLASTIKSTVSEVGRAGDDGPNVVPERQAWRVVDAPWPSDREGWVRLAPDVASALGLQNQDAVELRGRRKTAARVQVDQTRPERSVGLGRVFRSNAGVTLGGIIRLRKLEETPARRIVLRLSPPSRYSRAKIEPFLPSLLARPLVQGDWVLLPRPGGKEPLEARVASTNPPGPVVVRKETQIEMAGLRLAIADLRDEPVEDNEPTFPQDELLPGYDPDTADGKDRLSIEDDVAAFATLVSSKDLSPPLSIGLFGDWGMGKSFFINLMEKQVAELCKGPAAEAESPYCRKVVQVRFNAWHYIDGNLWASLVDHIFRSLCPPDDPTKAAAHRDFLLKDLEMQQKALAQAERRRLTLEGERDSAQRVATLLEEKQAGDRRTLDAERGRDIAAAAAAAAVDALPAQERERLRLAGREAWHALQAATKAGAGLRAKARLVWGGVRKGGRSSAPIAAWTLLVPAAVGAAVWLASRQVALEPLWSGAVVALSGITALSAKLVPYARAASQALEGYARTLETEQLQRASRIKEMEENLAGLAKQVAEAVAAEKRARAALEELQRQTTQLTPAEILDRFVAERAATDDYRRHLGLLAVIRRDFERLSDLMKGEGDGAAPKADRLRIDRIVLYIDDLDRCPPETVVKVLQAVHLLLAFRLFVVVVAVDARWVTRALRQDYKWLEDERAAASDLMGRAATPHDYLEKIFQVPFWVSPLDADGGGRLIEAMAARPQAKPAPAGNGQAAAADAGEAVPQPDDAGRAAPEARDTLQAPADAKPGPVEARTLRLSPEEVAALKAMAPLVSRSPRTVKRFVNCYRIVRASQARTLEQFMEGGAGAAPFEVAMLLLALLNGAPAAAHRLHGELGTGILFHGLVNDPAFAGLAPEARRVVGETLAKWQGPLPKSSIEVAALAMRFSYRGGPMAAPAQATSPGSPSPGAR